MGWGVFTLSLSLLAGVVFLVFTLTPTLTPRRIYDPEGEGGCWLVLMPVCYIPLCPLRERGPGD